MGSARNQPDGIIDFDDVSDVYDVVVAGPGAAGLVAALTAATVGARVLVVESASLFGGASAVSRGQVWVPEQTEGWNLEPTPLGTGPFGEWQEWVWPQHR
ncbi:FAD-dependent oxidoreductase [Nesterenkonia ebinurensis]|uniref:FAD-dependent oxidoreductase n=1 Tax=Nesterenkonia ebinurensis TaxID=2608252 RepID=UPI00168B8856|nr:FAD-dependent oxidoreductase [Nesterenkonia ebinurensis]